MRASARLRSVTSSMTLTKYCGSPASLRIVTFLFVISRVPLRGVFSG
jgi:hypothetical protein